MNHYLSSPCLLLIINLFTVGITFPAAAATYYVSSANCFTNGTGSVDQPWCTISQAVSGRKAGDRVLVQPGVYNEKIVINSSGTANNPLIIEAAVAGQAIIDGQNISLGDEGLVQISQASYVTFRGLAIRNSQHYCLQASGVSDVIVENLQVDGCEHGGMIFDHQSKNLRIANNEVRKTNQCGQDCGLQEAITISEVQNFVVEGNTVTDGTKEGIDVKDGSSIGEVRYNVVTQLGKVGIYLNHATQIKVFGNTIHDCGYSGIQLALGDYAMGATITSDNRIYRNLIWNCGYNGLQLWSTENGEMRNNKFFNNVLYHNQEYGILVDEGSGNLFANNILALNIKGSIYGSNISSNEITNNLFFNTGELVGKSPVSGDPLFVNPQLGDFHLQAGSPAIDQGIDMGESAMGRPDLGAFEFGGEDGCSCHLSYGRDDFNKGINNFIVAFLIFLLGLTIARARPLSFREVLGHARRKWYWVLLVFLLGAFLALVIKKSVRLEYQAEGTFRITRDLPAVKTDQNVHIPKEEPYEPLILANILMEEALSDNSLAQLFAKQSAIFNNGAQTLDGSFNDYLRKYTKIIPLTETDYKVVCRAKDPRQAQELAKWIINSSITSYQRLMRERVDSLAKFTRTQADQAEQELNAQDAKMVSFLREHPELLVQQIQQDGRLSAAGPDRLRVQATNRLMLLAGNSLTTKDQNLKELLETRSRMQRELRNAENAMQNTPTSGMAKLQELQEARRRLHELQGQGLGDNHPSIKQVLKQIAQLESESSTIEPGKISATAGYASKVRTSLQELNQQLAKRLGKAKTSPRLEATWGAMTREQRLLLQRYEGLNRLASAAIFNSRLGDQEAQQLAVLVDEPLLPAEPIGARGWMIFLVGILGALLLSVFSAMLLGIMDQRLFYSSDVSNLLHLSLLAELPARNSQASPPEGKSAAWGKNNLIGWADHAEEIEVAVGMGGSDVYPQVAQEIRKQERITHTNSPFAADKNILPPMARQGNQQLVKREPIRLRICTLAATPPTAPGIFFTSQLQQSVAANQMRILATRLQESNQQPCKIVMICGWEKAVGRTTVAANLALAFAEARRRVLLIDLGGGKKSLTQLLGLDPAVHISLHQQLSQKMLGLADPFTIYKLSETLGVLPTSTTAVPLAPVLSSEVFPVFLEQMRGIFEFIIFDTNAMEVSSDAVALNKAADEILLVVRQAHSKLSSVSNLTKRIDEEKIKGVVFNALCPTA